MIHREIRVIFFISMMTLFLVCAKQKIVACFHCEPAKQRFSIMRRALWKMWMITWFVAAEEAQSGKQRTHTQRSSVWLCLAHFNLLFNKELIERGIITAHTHPLWDCVMAAGGK